TNAPLGKWCVRHQSTKEDGSEQRESCDLRIDARRKVSGGDSTRDQLDGRFARLSLKMVMKPSHCTIPLGSLDESRKTRREGRIRNNIRDMAKDALKLLTWRAANEVRTTRLLKQLEGIGDQRDLVRPMAVNRCFADAGSTSGRFYGDRAITQYTELFEHRLQNHLSRALDSRVDSRLRPWRALLLRLG